MQQQSHIQSYASGAISFVGADATKLYSAAVLKSAIKLFAKTGIKVNRAYTPGAMLAAAGQITGKKYKRAQYKPAIDDLQVWCDTMSAALPKLNEKGEALA